MKYSQKTLHSSPERARYGVSFVSSKGNILCRLVKIELYKIFAIINRAIKGLHCMWKTTSHVTTTVGAAFSNREWLNLQWLMAWTSNYIPIKLWNMITRPFSNFKETLDNPSLILEIEWVFTSRWKSRIQFLVHLLISIKQCQWKETQISKIDCMA